MANRIGEETRAKIASDWPDILARLAAGELVSKAIKPFSRGEIRAFKDSNAELRAQWEDARESSAESFMDEALDVVRGAGYVATDEKGNPVFGKDGQPLIIRPDAAHARTLVDTLKWAARIRNPRAYSDKAQLDVNVRTVDLTRIISEANARLAGRAPRILEHDAPRALELLAPDMARLAQLL